jgi:hypothetical protein
MPLDQLFILTAAAAANEGMECAGTDYRDRKLIPDEMQSLVPSDPQPTQNNECSDEKHMGGNKPPQQEKNLHS